VSTGPTGQNDAPRKRAERADVRRNREALLASAAEAFAAEGVDASFEDIAKKAGVGSATLYRHFPTRGDLIAAVYRREFDALCADLAGRTGSPADSALAAWMEVFVAHVAGHRGMASALRAAVDADSPVFTDMRHDILGELERVLRRGGSGGVLRDDVAPEVVLRSLCGFCLVSDNPGWQDLALQQITLLVDALRYGARRS